MPATISLMHPSWLVGSYQLLDSGNEMKLERFGDYVLARPEPQALWLPELSEQDWEDQADAFFKKDAGVTEKGAWSVRKGTPDHWWVPYQNSFGSFKLKCSLSSFKHVGIFPEQAANWDYIQEHVLRIKQALGQCKVLNLFAYTGAASIAAHASGAEVTHLDAIKQTVTWAKDNMMANHLDGIRWMVEDASKFVQRENRRGNKYQGIILDPPAYGRGPNGEKWQLEDDLYRMLLDCKGILANGPHFLVINLYSLGFSALIVKNMIEQVFGPQAFGQYGELFLASPQGKPLPLGTFYRFSA